MIDRLSVALADRYRIERQLGQGGMATVYLAQDLKHDRKVALKVLKPELAAVLGADRFVVEIKTTASLQHPHILPLFDSGTADGFLYYVMPFIQGETLREKLDRETQLGVEEAVKIASDVADALQHAHEQGVIHRDIKPENILLAKGRPMVADFGIALAVSAAAGGRMTETGLSLGTPHYMSPEQATAEKEISARSDVYSLASVLYETLAGQPPHLGGSAQQIIMKIIAEPVPLVTTLRKSVPPNVAAALSKALEKLPADRFESAAAFARALADPSFRAHATVQVLPGPRQAELSWKWAAAALAVLAVGLGAVAGWALWHTDAESRDVGLPPNAPIQMAGQFRTYAVARDGSFIVYLARVGEGTQLWYRSLRGTDVHPIPGTEGASGTPRLYMSIDGTLMGTRITDLDSLTVGRSVPLVPMVRRSGYSGVGQFDIADDGTLTYVPGINADIGRLVRVTREGRLVPLPVEEAAYLRYAPSPDGQRLAVVAEGLQHQELRVVDLTGGTKEVLDSALFIGGLSWSPDGGALAYRKNEDPGEESLLLRRLDSPDRPIVLFSNRPPLLVQASSWLAPDFLLVGSSSPKAGAVIVDPTRTPATVDSLGLHALFVAISPDRRWIAYQNLGVTGVHLQPWPARDRRYLVDAEGTEPRWASKTELVYLSQYRAAGVIAASVYRTRIDPNARSPVGSRELIVRDPRFADTPGWSTATTPNGEVIYLQSPSENLGFYLRVIPGWVDQMKRAVDAANR